MGLRASQGEHFRGEGGLNVSHCSGWKYHDPVIDHELDWRNRAHRVRGPGRSCGCQQGLSLRIRRRWKLVDLGHVGEHAGGGCVCVCVCVCVCGCVCVGVCGCVCVWQTSLYRNLSCSRWRGRRGRGSKRGLVRGRGCCPSNRIFCRFQAQILFGVCWPRATPAVSLVHRASSSRSNAQYLHLLSLEAEPSETRQ